ncbi:MAG: protoporphyrinogen oxidase [Candidatus Rokuibacteriota bacterium]|nr:MAG: protoporphyrinogen oxidase [Candidatus Rokubacteria bacterium]
MPAPAPAVKLVVIGGGITGLAAAHRAVELARERGVALDLTLIEARERLGGTIASERVDGFLVEAGPDSFLSEKPWALALCRRLGVEDRLVRTDDRFRKVFVWFGGRLHPLPDGFQLLAPTAMRPFVTSSLFSLPGKLRMALDLVLPRGHADDESLGAFVRRRLGAEALERVAQPLVAGIYTADPDDLSLAATMPRFLEVERLDRSIILGLRRALARAPLPGTSGARWSLFVTFAGGMEELVVTLAARLPPGAAVLKQRVSALAREGERWRVRTAEGGAFDAERVIVATEAHATARLVRYLDPSLANLLGEIPYSSAATISLGYRRADVPHPLDGFGFVVPRSEGKALLAGTFSSVKYPGRAPAGHVLLRGFLGGMLNAAILTEDDGALVSRARAELREALGITAEPVLTRLHRWPASMPQYRVGHLARAEAIEHAAAALPGLALAGAAYRGVGIADCVRSGEAAAERTVEV